MMMTKVIGKTFEMYLFRIASISHWVEVVMKYRVTRPEDVTRAEKVTTALKAAGFTSHLDIPPKGDIKTVFFSKDGTADLSTWTADEELLNLGQLRDVFDAEQVPFIYATLTDVDVNMLDQGKPVVFGQGSSGVYPIKLKARRIGKK